MYSVPALAEDPLLQAQVDASALTSEFQIHHLCDRLSTGELLYPQLIPCSSIGSASSSEQVPHSNAMPLSDECQMHQHPEKLPEEVP